MLFFNPSLAIVPRPIIRLCCFIMIVFTLTYWWSWLPSTKKTSRLSKEKQIKNTAFTSLLTLHCHCSQPISTYPQPTSSSSSIKQSPQISIINLSSLNSMKSSPKPNSLSDFLNTLSKTNPTTTYMKSIDTVTFSSIKIGPISSPINSPKKWSKLNSKSTFSISPPTSLIIKKFFKKYSLITFPSRTSTNCQYNSSTANNLKMLTNIKTKPNPNDSPKLLTFQKLSSIKSKMNFLTFLTFQTSWPPTTKIQFQHKSKPLLIITTEKSSKSRTSSNKISKNIPLCWASFLQIIFTPYQPNLTSRNWISNTKPSRSCSLKMECSLVLLLPWEKLYRAKDCVSDQTVSQAFWLKTACACKICFSAKEFLTNWRSEQQRNWRYLSIE